MPKYRNKFSNQELKFIYNRLNSGEILVFEQYYVELRTISYMAYLFESFEGWKNYCESKKMSLSDVVLEYEKHQKGRTEKEIWDGLSRAWDVMKDAVHTGLEEDMTSRCGMVNKGAKKV